MRRYLRDRFREIMKLDDPPHRMALAFSVGVFVAFSPWIGLHILSCFLFAWVFRLNKIVLLTGNFVNNPWTIVPMYAFCLWVGVRITGSDVAIPEIAWRELGFGDLFRILRPFLWPFVAGTLVTGAGAAVLTYFPFLWAVRRYRHGER